PRPARPAPRRPAPRPAARPKPSQKRPLLRDATRHPLDQVEAEAGPDHADDERREERDSVAGGPADPAADRHAEDVHDPLHRVQKEEASRSALSARGRDRTPRCPGPATTVPWSALLTATGRSPTMRRPPGPERRPAARGKGSGPSGWTGGSPNRRRDPR